MIKFLSNFGRFTSIFFFLTEPKKLIFRRTHRTESKEILAEFYQKCIEIAYCPFKILILFKTLCRFFNPSCLYWHWSSKIHICLLWIPIPYYTKVEET